MRLSLAVLALISKISNVSAVNLTNEVAAQKLPKNNLCLWPDLSTVNSRNRLNLKPSNRGDSGIKVVFLDHILEVVPCRSVNSNRMVDADEYDQYEGQPKSFISNYAGK